jgi:hypothetical protein
VVRLGTQSAEGGAALHALAPGCPGAGWVVPLGLSLGIVALMGIAMAAVAILEFSKTE